MEEQRNMEEQNICKQSCCDQKSTHIEPEEELNLEQIQKMIEESNTLSVKYQKTTKEAMDPSIAEGKNLGIDLVIPHNVTIPTLATFTIDTEIRVELPEGYGARIEDRSGWAASTGYHVKAGVIDEDYRDTLKVIVTNCSRDQLRFRRGDRIAQLRLVRRHPVKLQEE